MKEIPIYQIDAFTDRPFAGNPAAVCILSEPLTKSTMQSLAMENNLSETAFLLRKEDQWEIRWFTPTTEVDLCGHATLAAAYVLQECYDWEGGDLDFWSPKSGLLTVRKEAGRYVMNFPADQVRRILVHEEIQSIEDCIGMGLKELYRGASDYIAVVRHEREVSAVFPNLSAIKNLPSRGLIVTAKGDEVDFVSRFFAPQSGIDEDPVTGSAHTSLTPLWSTQLDKKHLIARQLSSRGGTLWCTHLGNRCEIAGSACLYMVGRVLLV